MLKFIKGYRTYIIGWATTALGAAQAAGLVNFDAGKLLELAVVLLGGGLVTLRAGVDAAAERAADPINGARVRRSGTDLFGIVFLVLLVLVVSTGCANLRPLFRPTGPDRAMKVLRGDELTSTTIFEGIQVATCQDFTVRTMQSFAAEEALRAALKREDLALSGADRLRPAVAGIFAADELKAAEDKAEEILDVADQIGEARAAVRAASTALDDALKAEMLGGCILPVQVAGEESPREIICPVGEIRDRCAEFRALITIVAFTGTDLRPGGQYIPAGPAGVKGRSR